MDYDQIKKAAQGYQADMTRFLRAMISHPSESCAEKDVVACIRAEMEQLGYDQVEVDGLGNVIGWMGDGDKIIAIDSHRHRGRRQPEQLDGRPLRGLGGRRGDLRPRRLRPGGRHGFRGLRCQDHEGAGTDPRRLQDYGGRLRAGGGLRRYVLAVHRQQVLPRQGHSEGAGGVRHLHRAHRRRHLPGPPGPHGDPRGREGRLLPRFRSRAGRQRHLQDGRHPPGRARPQREPRR